jgi:hypothetical protein
LTPNHERVNEPTIILSREKNMPEEYPVLDPLTMDQILRGVVPEEVTRWVIFRYGTIVLCRDPAADPVEYATTLLEQWGPVYPGTPLGDFDVGLAGKSPGWLVNFAHDDIGTYVSPEEISEAEQNVFHIGLYGRAKREADSKAMDIVHIHTE